MDKESFADKYAREIHIAALVFMVPVICVIALYEISHG